MDIILCYYPHLFDRAELHVETARVKQEMTVRQEVRQEMTTGNPLQATQLEQDIEVLREKIKAEEMKKQKEREKRDSQNEVQVIKFPILACYDVCTYRIMLWTLRNLLLLFNQHTLPNVIKLQAYQQYCLYLYQHRNKALHSALHHAINLRSLNYPYLHVYPLSGPLYHIPPHHFNPLCSKYLLIGHAQASRSPP